MALPANLTQPSRGYLSDRVVTLTPKGEILSYPCPLKTSDESGATVWTSIKDLPLVEDKPYKPVMIFHLDFNEETDVLSIEKTDNPAEIAKKLALATPRNYNCFVHAMPTVARLAEQGGYRGEASKAAECILAMVDK